MGKKAQDEKRFVVGYLEVGNCVYGREMAERRENDISLRWIIPMTLNQAEKALRRLDEPKEGLIFELVVVNPKKEV